jgi:hypothetical protein
MKYVLMASIACAVVIAIAQLYCVFILSDVEMHRFTVISKQGCIEVRKYEPAVFISYTQDGNMFEMQNNAFRNLAGYIFGNNAREQKIEMTAPANHIQGRAGVLCRSHPLRRIQ